MDRRRFIRLGAAATGVGGLLSSCKRKKIIAGGIVGNSAQVGHLLRDGKFGEPEEVIKKKVVIVGGGISGLTAAWWLQKSGVNDLMVLDLEPQMGGNAAYGKNDISAYPWGAHYVPVPNNDLTEYLQFLEECGVITGRDAQGLPIYNDYYLCFDPQERLYINGRWQEGLIPHFGVPDEDKKQMERFLHLVDDYRHQKGTDGKDAFAIPVNNSSRDVTFTRLDTITIKQWLHDNGFTSPYLHWYVNYCTRDDYGTPHDITSAWAGIHYFAGRKGRGSNATHNDVLTWPEGNGWLANHLQKNLANVLCNNCLAVRIEEKDDGIRVTYYDTIDKRLKAVDADQCIAAVPQFVVARLLNDKQRLETVQQYFHYGSWMVANITVSAMKERSGAPLSWDNVIYESDSLGYVEATHELVQQKIPKRNLTYYLPLTHRTPAEERRLAHQKTHADWVELILSDLQKVHPNIRDAVEEINIKLWGHAMAQPTPGIIWKGIRQELSASINNKLHFAHTDLAGISIFEEAFYQGLRAAEKVKGNLVMKL